MAFIRKILRKIKRYSVAIFGSRVDNVFWQFRHIFEFTWPKSYISNQSLEHPHRKFLIEKISQHFPFESVLEFGCASGPNLNLLSKRFPDIKIYGIDISGKAVSEGRKYFENQGIKNISLIKGGIKALKSFDDKSIDVVFTDAVLIYFDSIKVIEALKEMTRIAKKAVILLELNCSGKSFYKDNWVHDYKNIINKIAPEKIISIELIPKDVWKWNEFGSIIEIKLL